MTILLSIVMNVIQNLPHELLFCVFDNLDDNAIDNLEKAVPNDMIHILNQYYYIKSNNIYRNSTKSYMKTLYRQHTSILISNIIKCIKCTDFDGLKSHLTKCTINLNIPYNTECVYPFYEFNNLYLLEIAFGQLLTPDHEITAKAVLIIDFLIENGATHLTKNHMNALHSRKDDTWWRLYLDDANMLEKLLDKYKNVIKYV